MDRDRIKKDEESPNDPVVFLKGLQEGAEWARKRLYATYASYVMRLLRRVLGDDAELDDLVQETFIQAYQSVRAVRDPAALKAWLSKVAVFTARGRLRKRKVRSMVRFWDPDDIPDTMAAVAGASTLDAMKRTYQLMDLLPTNERIAFSLRYLEGLPLEDVADLCQCSLATVKRRLASAEQKFAGAAREDAALARWVRGGRFGDEEDESQAVSEKRRR